jgi:phasin family protein
MPSDMSKPMENAFTQAMGQAKSASEDYARMFSDMKMPAMPDMEALMSTYKRNMEVFSAANRIALEGAQAVAKRHMEIMQQTMAELSDTMRTMTTAEAPQAKAAKQAELLKRAYERAVANTKELSELIQRSNGEALGLLNTRFTEAMDEVKGLIEKAAAHGQNLTSV